MKTQFRFRVAVVRPGKRIVAGQTVKATDHAWRTAIFGMGGSRRRLGRAHVGMIDGQPIAVIAELPETVEEGTPVWTLTTEKGLWAFSGPAAVHNDAGFGPAPIGISLDRLKEAICFDPDPAALAKGLKKTLEQRGPANA
jgi:hypothetical protein